MNSNDEIANNYQNTINSSNSSTRVELGGDVTITTQNGNTHISTSGVSLNVNSDGAVILDEKIPQGYVGSSFIDVNAGDWFFEDVHFMNNLMTGTSTAPPTFSPHLNISRGMIITILHRSVGLPPVETSKVFSDVPMDAWFAHSVAWGYENNIISGLTENTFAPNENMNREDLALLFTKYAEYMGVELPVLREKITFSDASNISSHALSSIETLYQAGVMNGKSGNAFDPKGNVTRAEIAASIRRLISISE